MKIKLHETLRISEKTAGKNVAALPVGSVVDAKIMKRIGGNDVILDINGKELRAHFQNGAPQSRSFSLILNERKDGLLFFSMHANSVLRLAPFLVSNQVAAFSNKALLRYLNAAPDSIFEFNRIAAGVDISGKGLASLFSSIAQRYDNPPWLFALANYLSFIGMGRDSMLPVDPQGRHRRDGQKKPPHDEDAAKLEISGIFEGAAMEEFLGSALSRFSMQDAPMGFEFPFFDGEGYMALKCLSYEGAWIFQADFSPIGRIEVMAKKIKDIFYVDVFVENDEVLDALKKQGISAGTVVLNFYSLKISVANLLAIYNKVYHTDRFYVEA